MSENQYFLGFNFDRKVFKLFINLNFFYGREY